MKPLIGLIALLLLASSAAHAQLLQWNTFGNVGTETSEASVFNHANLGASVITLGAGVTANPANANRFGARSWFDASNPSPTTLLDAIAENEYFQFTAAPNAGYSLSITSFVFSWERTATGINALTVRSSLDGFSSNLGNISGLTEALTPGNTINLTGLSNITTAITLRLYGYGATASAGNGGFDTSTNAVNIQLNGSMAAIPEPSTYAAVIGALALAGAMVHRRHHRRAESRQRV